jgi:catechol 2,3-dioxygenase-like lactoylglutathione lyase family enzyme
MAMQLKRVTTVVFTDEVDACSAFYTERLGFEQTMSVPAQQPGETGSQFVAITNGSHELMFQSFKSAEDDVPGAVARANPPSFMLYLEVPSLDAAIERMRGLEPAISRRKTFYGSEEIGYRDPCGTIVVLAEFPDTPGEASGDDAGDE